MWVERSTISDPHSKMWEVRKNKKEVMLTGKEITL